MGDLSHYLRLFSFASAILVMMTASVIAAQDIRFDAPQLVKVRAVELPERQQAPGTKYIECHFYLSVHFDSPRASDSDELVFELSPGNPFHQIADLTPKTKQSTLVEGPISIEKHDESNASIGVDLNGAYEFLHGNTHVKNGQRQADILKYQQKPVQTTVVASGTIRRGTGALVKLRKSIDATLEGQHRITVTWEVPVDWQADLVQITCTAISNVDRFVGSSESIVLSRQILVVPIVANDAVAIEKTRDFVRTDQAFRRQVDEWKPSGIDGWFEQNFRSAKSTTKEFISGKRPPTWKELVYRLDYRIDNRFVKEKLPKSLANPAQQWVADRNKVLLLSR